MRHPTKALLLGVALLAAILSGVAEARAAACPDSGGAPYVRFSRGFDPVRYDTRLSRAELSAKAGNLARPGRMANGLTVGGYDIRLSVRVEVRRNPGGGYCVDLTGVRGRMGHSGMTVFIAREYPSGTCEYRALLDHEMQHVDIFRRVFRQYGPRVEQRLKRAAYELPPFWVADAETAGEQAAKRLQADLRPVLRAMDQEQARLNATIDTDESYAEVASHCRNW